MESSVAVGPSTEPALAGSVNLQAELLQLVATAMDVLILHLLVNMFSGTRTYIALWPLLGVALGSHVLAAYLESRDVPSPRFEWILGGAAVLSFLLVVWSQFFASYALWDPRWIGALLEGILGFRYPLGPLVGLIAVFGYLWNRAINSDANRTPNVLGRFQAGLIVLVVFSLIRLVGYGVEMVGPVDRAIFWFFLAGMLALALRRAQIAGAHGHSVLGTRWFMLSMLAVGLILTAGAVLAGVFSRDFSRALFQPVVAALAVVGVAVFAVFSWIVQLLFMLLTPLLDFIARIRGDQPPAQLQRPAWLTQILQNSQEQDPTGPVALLLPCMGLMVVLIVLFLIWLYWSPVRRRRREIQSEVRESVWDWHMIPQAIGNLFQRRAPAAPEADPLAALAGDARYRYTVQVRRIYRQVLALAEARGAPRPLPQTADELLPVLARVLPGDPVPLQTITQVYDAVRYRTAPATAAEAATAAAAWQALTARAGTGE